jgi:hypothetical protein
VNTTDLRELEELAAAIEETEGLDPRAARNKARQLLSEMQRQAHRWNDRAYAAGNPTAINARSN